MLRFSILLVFLWQTPLFAQKSLLQSGPMVGYCDLREVMLWAQTKQAATVQFEFWEIENPRATRRTDRVLTEKNTGFTAKIAVEMLEPGKTYGYRVLINNKAVPLPYPTQFKTQTLWQWRSDPPAFSVATGSCAYVNEDPYDRPGKPYGSDFQIYTHMTAQKPDVMLWLGDNTYLREVDWNTRSGMLHRYTHTRSLPEMQPFLASTAHYAIWDDHDFGPNDSDGTWPHKETAWDVFKAFWANPTFGVNGQKGCTTAFQYADVDFFLLDNRYFRAPNHCKTCERTSLGKEQIEWLIGALAESQAPFKIVAVGGQFVTTSNNHETFAHYFPAERDTILARIERENIKGVVFLTGDKHYTELSALKNKAGNWVYDLTVSALTSGPYKGALTKDPNALRVEGTVFDDHNFAMLRFSGPRKERQMQIAIYDANGREVWAKTLKASEM